MSTAISSSYVYDFLNSNQKRKQGVETLLLYVITAI